MVAATRAWAQRALALGQGGLQFQLETVGGCPHLPPLLREQRAQAAQNQGEPTAAAEVSDSPSLKRRLIGGSS